VAALHAENARLRDTVERQRMLLEDKDAKIAGLEAGNAELEERIARLERLISRNSGNSSLPPSLDDQPGRTAPPARGKGEGRNAGKQPGSPGSNLAWSENPGRTVPHFPRGAAAFTSSSSPASSTA